MATNFPTSVDVLTNPVSNDSLNSPSHSAQHANANDAIEAVEDYLLNGNGRTGLVLVKSQTITSGVSSVSVTSCFNSTFDAYKIVFTGVTTASAAGTNLQFGTSNTGYYSNTISLPAGYSSSGTVGYVGNNNGASFFTEMVTHSTSGSGGTIEVQNAFAATTTTFQSHGSDPRTGGVGLRMNSGFHNVNTSYTDLTFFVSGTTFTGGRISVYGYTK